MGGGCSGCFEGRGPPKPEWTKDKDYDLFATPKELKLIQSIRKGNGIAYDPKRPSDRAMLLDLFRLSFPDAKVPDLDQRDERWKNIGFQAARPHTDFRAAGLGGLRQMLVFAKNYPMPFRRILAEGKFPFAIASINVTEIIVAHLKLRLPAPKIAPVPFESLFDLQSFALLTASTARVLGSDSASRATAVFDELHSMGMLYLDHVWATRMAKDRSTNILLHFKLAMTQAASALRDELDARPASIKDLHKAFMRRLPLSYQDSSSNPSFE